MKRFLDSLDGFFFARRSAWPFGLMRIGWATVAFAFFLRQLPDVTAYYADDGFVPRDIVHLITRDQWIFSVLSYGGSAAYVWAWFVAMLVAFACSALGVFPRTSTIAAYLMMASFHERDAMTLGGGDTLLRNIGFILAISPGIHALSLSRLRKQRAAWKATRALLPPVTMPAWPYRLLLWQMMVLYLSSLWWKLLGDMWIDGTAVGAAMHHAVFLRWPYWLVNYAMPFAAYVNHATLAWEALWLLLLVPAPTWRRIPLLGRLPIKRLVMAGGVAFHGGIFFWMDVGVFPFALACAYAGLLDDGDRSWLKKTAETRQRFPLTVLYDGSCRLCRRSALGLGLSDAFGHLKLVDFRDAKAKDAVAPHLHESQLDLAMHVLLPDGSVRTGYDGFRAIAWHLPVLWPASPFLGLPGIRDAGRVVYARIARNREKCTHDRC